MIRSRHITDHLAAADFATVKFMTADEKLKVAKQWERFVRARCAESARDGRAELAWTKSLYDHFHLRLGHIAHYNIRGFFEEQWLCWEDFRRNMEGLADDRDGIGSPLARGAWGANSDYEDLGHWIVEVAKEYLDDVYEWCLVERQAAADHQLEAAKRNHEDAYHQ